MNDFLNKLEKLNLFLVEKEGDLILKGRRGKLDAEEIRLVKENDFIIDYIKHHKAALVRHLSKQSDLLKKQRTIYKLSPLQEGMLFHYLYDEDSNAYVEQFVVDIDGAIDREAFQAAWDWVLNNHSILRSAFLYDKVSIPVQTVYQRVELPITELDFSDLEATAQSSALQDFLERDLRQGFQFDRPPLMRIKLIKVKPNAYKMVWTYHHILLDGWSLPIIVGELLRAYEAHVQQRELPVLSEDRYETYIQYLDSKDAHEEENFWKSYFEGFQSPSLLPFVKNTVDRNKGGGSVKEAHLSFDPSFTKSIRDFARQHNITVNTLLQGIWAFLLAQYNDHDDAVFGVTVSGRPTDLALAEQRVGLYINILPLRSRIDQELSVGEWLSELQESHVLARDYQYSSLNNIQKWNQLTGDLFDSLFVFENYPVEEVLNEKDWLLRLGEVQVKEQTNYLLTIVASLAKNLKLKFIYNDQLLEEGEIELIKNHFTEALHQIVALQKTKLSEIDILTTSEKKRLLDTSANQSVAYPEDKTLVDLFEEQAAKTPDNIAIEFLDQSLTYRQLDERSDRWAATLNRKGVQTESMVVLCLDHSIEAIVCILGIIKAGGGYVPVDPDYPQERINYLLEDSAARFVITQNQHQHLIAPSEERTVFLVEEIPSDFSAPVEKTTPGLHPDNLAYVIYTSGSTGRPKGVEVTHRNLVRLFVNEAPLFDFNERDRWTFFHSYCFDFSVWEMYGALLFGGKLIVLDKEVRKDPGLFSQLLVEKQVTVLNQTPSSFYQVQESYLEAYGDCNLRYIIFGGEALNPAKLELWKKRFPDCKLVNMYGITETTVHVTYKEIVAEDIQKGISNIGLPIPTLTCYVLDKKQRLCPIGVPGEMYIAGAGLARGYLKRESLTEERFIPNPFSENGEDRLYKTGDLARWLADGRLEYLGRIDSQVKIRGYRIELGEIEAVLHRLDRVKQCAVLAVNGPGGSPRLVAYVVAENVFDKAAARSYLSAQLPGYMVPSAMLELKALPLTSNGKLDRKALPLPSGNTWRMKEPLAPRNETEQILAAIWQELLQVEMVGVQDDFFESGGHSLLAIRLSSAVRKKMGLELKVKTIFTCPTIESLAQYLGGKVEKTTLPQLIAGPRPERIPLSFAQERLWFIDQFEGSIQYHIPTVLQLENELDREVLEKALAALVERHEILRTVIRSEEGKPYQEIRPSADWKMEFSKRPRTIGAAEWESFIRSEIRRPFDLAKDYMLRVHLVQRTQLDHLLILVVHHIASDGWSQSLLVKDLVALYQGLIENREVTLPEFVFHYADYAIWQRINKSEADLEAQLSWWEKQLSGIEPLLLPTDFVRPVRQSTRGATHRFQISKPVLDQLKSLSTQSGATLFMTLLSAFKILLYRYSGQEDQCVGTPLANRNYQELESIVGFFINTLVLRDNLSGNPSFRALLEQVKENTLAAFAHQDVPFERVVDRVEAERNLSRSPVFQVMFILQNTPESSALELGNLQLSAEPMEYNTAQFDLTFSATESTDGLWIDVGYCSDLFLPASIQKMTEHFQNLLEAILAQPEEKINQLEMLSREEQEQLLFQFNDTARELPEGKSILDLFEEKVARQPAQIALHFREKVWTYRELNQSANQIAHYLIQQEVEKSALVGVCMDRTPEMIAVMLGILKIGAAYVPIDPAYPLERIRYILEDARVQTLISEEKHRKLLPASEKIQAILLEEAQAHIGNQSTENPEKRVELHDLAYIIYTSGSTGQPKGVMINQGNLFSFVHWCREEFHSTPFDIVYAATSICFDLSIFELFYTLCVGKKIRLLESALEINTWMAREEGVLLNTVPSVIQKLLEGKTDWSGVSVINMAGEPIPVAVKEQLDLQGIAVRNLYGPSEDTTYSTVYRLSEETPILIGKPIANTQVYIVDPYLNLLPQGAIGELCISGSSLSTGYLHREALTAEKFVDHPFFPNLGKLYRTGDLARWLPDGQLEFVGRRDSQVKIRGYRIELGEIESALLQLPTILQSVVLAKADVTGEKRLVAYVVGTESFEKEFAQEFLRSQLPGYMLPSWWVVLPELPLTANGKVDKKALPDPLLGISNKKAYLAPRNATEELLAEIWRTLLPVDKIGVRDNFFEIGGHSLLAMRVIAMIRRQTGKELEVKDLFAHTTIEQLSRYLQMKSQDSALPPVLANPRPERIPVSYSQERLWFIDQLTGSTQYHRPTVLRLKNHLDPVKLEMAFTALVDRHEVLRTVIRSEEGKAYQEILPAGQWKMTYSKESSSDEAEKLQQIISAEVQRPFDLSRDYLLRGHLVRFAANDHVLILVIHHIATDGWSESILVKDLAALYQAALEGTPPQLEPLPVQYADYAIWQRKHISGTLLAGQLDWWEQGLQGVEPLELPIDYPRPSEQSTRGASYGFRVDNALTDALKQLSVQNGASLFMTLIAAYKVLLYRYSGQEDICIGTPIANRNDQALEPLVGFFINTLVLRNDLGGNPPFKQLLEQVKSTTLAAFAHQEVPFEQIVDRVESERNLSRNPIFQVTFAMQNTPEVPTLELGGLSLSSEAAGHRFSRFDLNFSVSESPAGLQIIIEYCSDLFSAGKIERMAGHFQNLIQSIVAKPQGRIGHLEILGPTEKEQLLVAFNNTNFDYPKGKTIVDIFEQQVRDTPDNIALIFEEITLTYHQLDARANRLGHYLRQNYAIEADDLVGILQDRSDWMIVTILGILKAGGGYVPIDKKFPENRIQYMMEDSQCKLVIDDAELEKFKKESHGYSDHPLAYGASPNSRAYLIYTSGSTGRSKGVQIEHRSLVNEISYLRQQFQITEEDRILQTANYVFDPSVEQIFLALSTGASLVMIPRETLLDGELMARVLDEKEITYLHLTPSLMRNIPVRKYNKLRQISSGGELCSLELARAWSPFLQFVNKYGPTEATITSTIFPFDPAADSDKVMSLAVGKPLGNEKVYVVDAYDNLVPIGVNGEIYIGGEGLARGYLNREALTLEKFIDSPFVPGEKVYKTGDLGRWLPNGNLEFISRKDDQVKIRGYRIELGEIETVMHQAPQVEKCVVLAKAASNGDRRLVAYLVPNGPFDKEAIRQFLEKRLPEYMVPPVILPLEAMPLTINGKVDRKALPEPDALSLDREDHIAPRNETEEQLVQICQDLLQVEKISITDNFFEIGGHSLLAMRLVSSIRKTVEKEVKVKDVFTKPVLEDLAAYLSDLSGGTKLPAISALARPEKIPLSYAQERLWFIDQLEGSAQYHQSNVLRLKNHLDRNILQAAFSALVDRHEVLRTIIKSEDGQPYQEVLDAANWQMNYSEGPEFKDENFLRQWIREEVNRPFDLSDDYMLRAHLVKCSETEHVLILVMHHIVSDGWSQSLLVEDLVELYQSIVEARSSRLPALPVQYADYAIWQKQHVSGDYLEEQLSWWEKHLSGVEVLRLPTDFPRPSAPSNRGRSTGFVLDKTSSERLKALAIERNATLFMTLLSVFNVLLYRYSGQDDICVGTPLANRDQKEIEPLVGFFINNLVLRNDLGGQPRFDELLDRVKANTLAAFSHQEVPFEKIVDRVESDRDLGRSPLFQVVFLMQNTPEVPELKLGDLSLSFEPSGYDSTRFDLTVSAQESPEGLRIALAYSKDLFEAATVEQMAQHFQNLLTTIALDPKRSIAQLPMLSREEENHLLRGINIATSDYPKESTMVELMEAQLAQTPDRDALVYQDEKLSYRQLHEQTNQLAHCLREKGIGSGDFVAICLEDSLAIVRSILAILKTGATYIPLDHENPAERINFILDHTQAKGLISTKAQVEVIAPRPDLKTLLLDEEKENIAQQKTEALQTDQTPESLLYVIHTSGSTGKPKGVMLSHRNVIDHLYGFFSRVTFRSSRSFAIMSTMSADLANTVLFGALISGGTIHLIAKEVYTDAHKTHAYFKEHSIDFIKLVPSHWRALENEEGVLLPNRTIVLGGEVLSIEILEKIKKAKPSLEIINHYGPTEVTIGKVCYRVDFDQLPEKTPIGKPFCNTHMYVVDRHLQPCPIGVPGELLIGGDGVSKGYINRPDLTAERYIPNPFNEDENDILYRSGDSVRWLRDGNLDFMERVDDQVKIRGYRIELGEITAVLDQAPGVVQGVVMARPDQNQQKRLVAYLIPDEDYDKPAVQQHLQSQLPEYMVPSVFISLDKFSLNANGKVDRHALPDIDTQAQISDDYVGPTNKIETQLVGIWQELLQLDKIGIYDNFFEIGGHSLLAMRVITAIRKAFDMNIPIKVIFQYSTIAELQNYIQLIRESEGQVDQQEVEIFEL